MSCGPKTGWCRNVPTCQRCTLAATSEPHWRNWGLSAPLIPLSGAIPAPAATRRSAVKPPAARPAPLPMLPACKHEGDIIYPCGSYYGGDAERRHVRECDLLGEFCTRAEPKGHKVCASCAGYVPM